MDVFTPEQRSEIMSRIRSTGTQPEERLYELARTVVGKRRKILRNAADWEGTPDLLIPSLRLAVFADGCFFHGCPRHCRMPATNREYWERKIQRNRRRDARCRRQLRRRDVSVWRFWEHDLRPARWDFSLRRLERAVREAIERTKA